MKEENKEIVLCAAIYFDDGKFHPHQPKGILTGVIMCGYRHCSIFTQTGMLTSERNGMGIYEKEQGFLTNKNRFVDRTEAAKIALESGQIKELKYWEDRLDSSDLY